MEIERAARIAAIKQHPAWPELTAHVDETIADYTAALAKTMLATGKPYDDFEFKRGYLAGMKAITRYPDTATAALKREAARHEEQQASE